MKPYVALALSAAGCADPKPVEREPERIERAVLVATIAGTDSSNGFGSVRSVLLDGDGGVYVVDNRSREVSRFDSLGRFERRLGREGAGPGEYRDPYSLAWIGDTLALLDPANGRIGLFGKTGEWVGSWRVPLITGSQNVRLYRTPPDGFWAYGIASRGDQQETVFIHYTSGGPTDTVAFVRADPSVTPSAHCEIPGGMTFFAAPFAPKLLVVPTPERERAANLSSEYRVAFLNAGGDTTRTIERPFTPVPISDAEWEAANAEFRWFRASNPKSPCSIQEFKRPESKPAVKFMFYDADGGLWVELTTVTGSRYEVFDRNGSQIRSVEGLPESGGIDPSVRGNRVAIVARDSLDVPQVRLYRIDKTH